METLTLKIISRHSDTSKNYLLREEGFIPAIVYGEKKDPEMITISRNDFFSTFRQAGESTLVYLEKEGSVPEAVLIQDYQVDPLYNKVIHADFRRVDLNKPIIAEVQLQFVGESSAVRQLGGILIHVRDVVEVRALPTKLVKTLEIDLSPLKTFDDSIRLGDISLPEGMEIIEDLSITVATVAPPRTDEELKDLDKAVEADVSTIQDTKKKEVAEPAEVTDDTAKKKA